jgi:hypothetical protein
VVAGIGAVVAEVAADIPPQQKAVAYERHILVDSFE